MKQPIHVHASYSELSASHIERWCERSKGEEVLLRRGISVINGENCGKADERRGWIYLKFIIYMYQTVKV